MILVEAGNAGELLEAVIGEGFKLMWPMSLIALIIVVWT